VGDFGRAQSSVLHDEIMPAIGNARAQGSTFNMADQEIEMRDRIWRYLVAPHAYDWFGDIAVEYQRTRILPMSNKPLKTRLYYDWLHSERFASSRTRYGWRRSSLKQARPRRDLHTLPAARRHPSASHLGGGLIGFGLG
jgi:hypothetical protein